MLTLSINIKHGFVFRSHNFITALFPMKLRLDYQVITGAIKISHLHITIYVYSDVNVTHSHTFRDIKIKLTYEFRQRRSKEPVTLWRP